MSSFRVNVGLLAAKEMVFSGRVVSGAEAVDMCLANQCVPDAVQVAALINNGTTHFVFELIEFLAKLAALVPRPRTHLTRYHGVLAPNAKYRNLVVPTPNRRAKKKRNLTARAESLPDVESDHPLAPLCWVERLKRVFKIDITLCPRCGGRLRIIAAIAQPDVIQKNLDHARQQQAPPRQPPGRINGPITSELQFDAL